MRIKREFIHNPHLVLYLPLYKLDGVSFKSHDAYGHLCTVTGATWRIQGRTMAGGDDYIAVPAHASLAITDKITILMWIKAKASSLNQTALGKSANSDWRIYENPAGSWRFALKTAVDTFSVASAATVTNWNLFGGTYDKDAGANNMIPYLNGVAGTPATATGAINDTSASVLYIGIRGDSTPPGTIQAPYNGIYGELWIYNRALSQPEISRIHQYTGWRYV